MLTLVASMVMAAVACGPVETHKLTRTGEPVDPATLATEAKKSFSVDGAQISVDGQRSASAVSSTQDTGVDNACYGWCTQNYCECRGDLGCCIAGCTACWEVLE